MLLLIAMRARVCFLFVDCFLFSCVVDFRVLFAWLCDVVVVFVRVLFFSFLGRLLFSGCSCLVLVLLVCCYFIDVRVCA